MKRNAELIPKNLQIRFKDKSLSICYSIQDNITKAIVGDTWVNFTPSEQLLKLLHAEVSLAIKLK